MDIKEKKGKLNKILSQSYIFYFMMFFVGISVDLMFPTEFLKNTYSLLVGFFLIVISTLFIFWIKLSSKKKKEGAFSKEDFMKGPYKYTSVPNHWGIFVLILGFGVMINAIFMIIISILFFIITLPFFLKMQEKVLVEKYGSPYSEYRKIVRL